MTQVTLLRAPGCWLCVQALRLIQRVQADVSFELTLIDVLEHPELLIEHGLIGVPGVLLDGRLEFAGVINERQFRRRLAELAGVTR